MGRIEKALKRFRKMKLDEAVGLGDLRGGSGRRGPTSLPPLDLFVSPWQFAPADEAAQPPTETPGLRPEPVEPGGRLATDGWLPGVVPAASPPKIDCAAFVAPAGSVRVSSMAAVDEAEANLAATCQVASAAIVQPADPQAHEVQLRLARRIAFGQGTLPVLTQEAFEDLLAAVGAARGRLVVRAPDATQATTLAVVGGWLTTMPIPDLEPLRTEFGPDRIVTTVRLTGGGAAGAEFQAVDRVPLTRDQAFLAEAGMALLGTWLSGVTSAAAGKPVQQVGEVRPAPTLEDAIGGEMERVKRLSLKGGVLVAKFTNGGPPRGWTVASVIEAMREELRSSDLLGQLPTGEITALLVRASADGVVSVACRVRERLEALACQRRLPPIELGHALYPDGGAESLSALVERARAAASCGSDSFVGDRGGGCHQGVLSES
jgi:hypothetical protein